MDGDSVSLTHPPESAHGCQKRWTPGLPAVLLLFFLTPTPSAAQGTSLSRRAGPTTSFMVAGYGTAGWQATGGKGKQNDFFGSVSPLLLFQFGSRFIYEAELEFEVEEGATKTSLEYAQLDFFLNDNLTVVAGKFLLPFGVFGERLHPTWINRFASHPPLFGHGGGNVAPLLPILSDFGAMVRGSWAFEGGRTFTASLFVTQGPSVEEHDEEEGDVHAALVGPGLMSRSETQEEGDEHGDFAPLPEFQFGESTADVNQDKLVGARIGWVLAPNFEVDLSALTGAFDDDGSRLTGVNLAAEFRRGGTEFRGEGFALWYDVEEPETEGSPHDGGETVLANSGGYYLQASHRRGPWEPVVRWTQTVRASAKGYEDRDGFMQAGVGLNYWFSPAIALMASYEINDSAETDLPDRFLVHWSFGF